MDVESEIAAGKWYHRFEVLPGHWTDGQFDIGATHLLDGYGVPQDLSGKTVGDIGAWDGAVTFALEERGATVYGLDIQDPDQTCFNRAKRLRNSNARYIQTSVYNVSDHGVLFDAMVFNGVFYHLKHPILAFEKINAALKMGGTLYFSGECLLSYAETLGGEAVTTPELRAIATSDIPLSAIYPGKYKGASNWFTPNVACLKGWCEASGFRIERYWLSDGGAERPEWQSFHGVATKVGEVIDEHPLVGKTMWVPGAGY